MRWSDYTTGERIKILRGSLTQEQLAEAASISVPALRKAERDLGVGLPTLLKLSGALHTDVSVVLGQQEPRRAMRRDDRAMLRELSASVHDTAVGLGIDVEPPPAPELSAGLTAAWDRYREGQFARAGALAGVAVRQAAACRHSAPADQDAAARAVLADAFRLAAYVALQFGARDLAYAAIGHAQVNAERAGDPLREAMVASGRAWISMRNSRLDQAAATAERSYAMIEPGYGDDDPYLLATYGWHTTFAAVVAARKGDTAHSDDLLAQARAVAGRMGRDVEVNGTAFGPTAVAAQSVGIYASTGRPAAALKAWRSMRDVSVLTTAARNRLALDVALAQCDTRQWDAALDTLLEVCTTHPDWARHQALPDVIARRASRENASASRYRKLAAILETPTAIR